MTPSEIEAIKARREKKYFGVHFEAEMDDVSALLSHVDELRGALTVVLPMARGYAAANPVGNNAEMIQDAQRILGETPP